MAGYRNWTDADRLDAAALMGYLMGQVVCRFSSVEQRDAQLATPVAGMISYVPTMGLQRHTGTGWVTLVCPSYPTVGLPDPSSVPVGTAVYDSTQAKPLWSSGAAWIGVTVTLAETGVTSGVVVLVDGTATVAVLGVTAVSRIGLTAQALGTVTVPSALAAASRVPGTSFTILASQPTDTSTVAWWIMEPSA